MKRSANSPNALPSANVKRPSAQTAAGTDASAACSLSLVQIYALPGDEYGRVRLTPAQMARLYELLDDHLASAAIGESLTDESRLNLLNAAFANELHRFERPKLTAGHLKSFEKCGPKNATEAEKKEFGVHVAALIENAKPSAPKARLVVKGRRGVRRILATPRVMAERFHTHAKNLRSLDRDWHALFDIDRQAALRLLSTAEALNSRAPESDPTARSDSSPLGAEGVPATCLPFAPFFEIANRLDVEAAALRARPASKGGRPVDHDGRSIVNALVTAFESSFGAKPPQTKGSEFFLLLESILQLFGIPSSEATVARLARASKRPAGRRPRPRVIANSRRAGSKPRS